MIKIATTTYREVTAEEFQRTVMEAGPLGKIGAPKFKIGDVVRTSYSTGVVAGIVIGSVKDGAYYWRHDIHVPNDRYNPIISESVQPKSVSY